MPTQRIGILPAADRQAIFDAAKRLQLDPYELGGFLSLESGMNMDPNIWGGAGGNYYGMIQFGRNEQRQYLDPNKIGKYTRAEQMPKAVQFLLDRGFKPGQMGIDRAYATVLGGNPNVPLTRKDSFGTSVAGALPRFRPGGDLYKNAQRVLGDRPGDTQQMGTGQTPQAAAPKPQAPKDSDDFQQLLSMSMLSQAFRPSLMQQVLSREVKDALSSGTPGGFLGGAESTSNALAGFGFPAFLGLQ